MRLILIYSLANLFLTALANPPSPHVVGIVERVNANSLTISDTAGDVFTFTIRPSTDIHVHPLCPGDIVPGNVVSVHYGFDNPGLARKIFVLPVNNCEPVPIAGLWISVLE